MVVNYGTLNVLSEMHNPKPCFTVLCGISIRHSWTSFWFPLSFSLHVQIKILGQKFLVQVLTHVFYQFLVHGLPLCSPAVPGHVP